ncbi:melatonin receptor type 1B-B [Sardina pilchardus]|uniref:melatonin receptor type 1B-B n=1 Tax=Sardina pilchardus TaxID=27697 RepID=UPI002E0D5464
MPENIPFLKNRTELGHVGRALGSSARPAWAVAALASVLIFTTVVDVLGNLLVIISVCRNRKLRNAGNVFVVSLAFADLVVAFYPYPLVLYAIFHDGWSLGDTQCKVSGFLMGLSVIGSIFNITAIAINRYCYICHSFAYGRLYSCRNTLLLVALVWALTVLAILPNLFVGSLQYDPRVYSCTFAQTASASYTIAVVVVHFLVPIAVVTFCYLRIWILVIQVRRKVKSSERPRLRPSDLRNFVTMFVVFVLFAICWAPLNLIGLAVAIDPQRIAPHIPEWLFVVSYFMAYFNSCLNAIIYGLLNRNFRKEYMRIVTSVWMPRLFVTETSRAATDNMRSKPSPAINNNE